jgi:GPH family glycoside/pentoside/hexuronide:cation symporter
MSGTSHTPSQDPSVPTQAAPADNGTRKEAFTASNLAINAWATGKVSNYWMYSTLNQLDFPLKTTFGVPPWVLGVAMAAPRIVDGLLDPLLGHLSDITHTRWGRRRPWLMGAAILGAFMTIAIWWLSPGWPNWAHLLFLTPMCVLLFSIWGTYDMTHTALGYELSDDYNQRSKVIAIGSLWFSLAALGGGFFYSTALILKDGFRWEEGDYYQMFWGLCDIPVPDFLIQHPITPVFPGNEIQALRTLSYIVGGLVLVFGVLPFFVCRERFQKSNKKHVKIWTALRQAISNKPYRLILALNIIQTFGGVFGGVGGMVLYYYVCQGNKLQSTGIFGGIAGVVGLLTAILMVPLAAPLTKKLGKRSGLLVGYGAGVIGACAAPFIVLPGQPWLLFLPSIILAIPGAIGGTMMASAFPDICDVDELQSGERREGLYTAVNSFISKLQISVVSLLGNVMITWCGCDPMQPSQPEHVVTLMRWLWLGPGILIAIVLFILAARYPLTENVMADVRRRLDERHAATATAEAASASPPPGQ